MTYNLAILHHHLNRGGVTQVIANHLRALNAVGGGPERVLIVYGGRRSGWPESLPTELHNLDIQLCEVSEIDYDDGDKVASSTLAHRLQDVLATHGCPPQRTVVHVHNHSLGKNLSLPGAIGAMADAGYHLLLQIHDFAEDFRPQNYLRLMQGLGAGSPVELGQRLYPQAAHIHYAVLNGRDRTLLENAGIAVDRLHLLPNPVHEFGELPDKDAARNQLKERFGVAPDSTFLVYPVRGIRRKNLGEALLWSALFDSGLTLGLTLKPMNPLELPHYEHWVRLADELKLPFRFGLGEPGGLGFTENLSAADGLLTTSVAEGFGMVFLETWLAGRPLLGRDLPEITADFKSAGLQLDELKSELRIPLEWIDQNRFRAEFTEAYRNVLNDYGQQATDNDVRAEIPRLFSNGTLDFAFLSGSLQARVIRRVATGLRERDAIMSLNPWIADSVRDARGGALDRIANNAKAVRAFASLEVSGRKLSTLYEDVLRNGDAEPGENPVHGGRILGAFLDVSRFHPIRVAP